MLRTYKTKDAFLSAVSSALDAQGTPPDLRTPILSGLASADDDLRSENRELDSGGLNLKLGAWIIRDDDLPIFTALNTVATAVAASLVSGGLAWPLVATALTGLADLCWRAWRKGARLSSLQVTVYGFLKARGPLAVEELARLLEASGQQVPLATLRATLRGLTQIDINTGNLVALAKEDKDHVWQALRI